MCAAVAVRALVDHEGAGAISISSAPSRNSDVECARLGHLDRVEPALARHEAEIEARHAGGRRMQNRKAVPTVGHGPEPLGDLGRKRRDRRAVGSRQRALPQDHHGPLALGLDLAGKVGQRVGSGAEVFVLVGQVGGSPITSIGKFPMRQRLRMRALSTGLSRRGLLPMMSSDVASRFPRPWC